MVGAGLQNNRFARIDDETRLQLAHSHDAIGYTHLVHFEPSGIDHGTAN